MSNVQKPEPAAWPKVNGVGRDADNERILVIYFDSEPTDNQLRAVHDILASPQSAEAYAAERVREALEDAVSAIEVLRTSGTIRYAVVEQCASAVTALIPKL